MARPQPPPTAEELRFPAIPTNTTTGAAIKTTINAAVQTVPGIVAVSILSSFCSCCLSYVVDAVQELTQGQEYVLWQYEARRDCYCRDTRCHCKKPFCWAGVNPKFIRKYTLDPENFRGYGTMFNSETCQWFKSTDEAFTDFQERWTNAAMEYHGLSVC